MIKYFKFKLKNSNTIYYFFKGVVVYFLLLIRCFIYILSFLLPIERKQILCRAYEGRGYTCNPKAITEYILQHSQEYNIIWAFTKLSDFSYLESRGIKIVKVYSLKYYYYYLTSEILIFNDFWSSFIKKRKGQIFINTWHGSGALKCVGLCTMPHHIDKLLYKMRHSFGYMISGCQKFTEVREKSFGKNIIDLEFGLPRNDLFYEKENAKQLIIRKVKDYFKLQDHVKLVLYAPTYRENFTKEIYGLSILETLNALEKKFGGEWFFLLRGHYFNENNSEWKSIEKVYNASFYPDMQDLLLASDVLITDYSSSSWDFSLQNKPCFLYTPDLEDYKKDFSFYNSIDVLPYTKSRDNRELINNILLFNEMLYIKNLRDFYYEFQNFESGKSREKLFKMLENLPRN